MSNKPTEQKPVARPTAEKPKKMSARDRRALRNQPAPLAKGEPLPAFVTYGNHKEPEANSPKVAEAKVVLDRLSETLAPEGAAPKSMGTATTGILVRCAYHDRMEDAALFSSNKAHKSG